MGYFMQPFENWSALKKSLYQNYCVTIDVSENTHINDDWKKGRRN